MNEFDRFLELELRTLLDPVVEAQPPARGVKSGRRPIVAVIKPAVELAADAIPVPVAEPVAVAVPAAQLRTV